MKPLAPYQSPIADRSGLACLKMLLEHNGKDAIELDLAGDIGISEETEPTPEQLIEAAKKEQAAVASSDDSSIDDLRLFTEQNMPCIVYLQNPNQYVIVYQVGKTKTFTMNPLHEQGISIIPIDLFEKRWSRWFMGLHPQH